MPKKIFLIDDDPDDRDLFCEALQGLAPEIRFSTAPTGKQALADLKNADTPPDLIFLDINMPVMSGWQCLSLLKKDDSLKHIPVVMYSTSSHAEELQRAREGGALCFFCKPAHYHELVDCMQLVVRHINNNTLHLLADDPRFHNLLST